MVRFGKIPHHLLQVCYSLELYYNALPADPHSFARLNEHATPPSLARITEAEFVRGRARAPSREYMCAVGSAVMRLNHSASGPL